ncbi:carbamate kinase [Halolactibacillus alkaliphilus]|uniref:Carbamate kinase n=1 Tax=Halolactibacillus alkaliphilus TaxID=442899 RepID=A0A511WWV3_9BACI|nr:carbamate kinase [Halolactibacillus alkaliphilus]GEN55604.1 carbamate kinase [Halolactibacillus alkaliphilus]GGN63794.1 carbamate kinase [Halolactibacillus alkaliphilus]SFO62423.1 carbamate kinase [Halolactibacillus alkaliphilus]
MIENKKIIVALGGNAILSDDPTAEAQIAAIRQTCDRLVDLVEHNNQLIISHGNGPQVGNLLLQQQLANSEKNPALPLDACVAMTEGSIGYWMQNEMSSILKKRHIDKSVVSLITRVEVDKDDVAFEYPTKPIGPFLTEVEVAEAREDGGKYIEDSGRGYRKVVPSPKPVGIVECDTVKQLIEHGVITISCGGGGIPVLKTEEGYKGVEAVIDKDFASEKLAEQVKADVFIILTGVDHVYINFNKPNQKKLEQVTTEDLKQYIEQGQFEPGSMLPKIEAAVQFVEASDHGIAIITSLGNLDNIHQGAGTVVVKHKQVTSKEASITAEMY